MPAASSAPSPIRVTIFMSALFAGTGMIVPFLPSWLEDDRGLSGVEIGYIIATAMLARIVTGPLIAAWADGQMDRRRPLIILAATTALAFTALSIFQGFGPLLVMGFIAFTLNNAMVPLVEAALVRATRDGRHDYGVLRSFGSLSFILANLGGGVALAFFGPSAAIIWVVACCFATLGVAMFVLPPDEAPPGVEHTAFKDRLREAFRLARHPVFAWTLEAAGLIQAAHAFYYGFGTLVWQRQGVGSDWVGVLWAIGVASEIVLLALSGRYLMRVRPELLILIGGVLSVVRWFAMALSPPLWALVFLQMLHAGSFALTHIGAIRIIHRETPEELHATGQTLYAALSGGLFIGIATLVSGFLYQEYGAYGYAAMAAVATMGMLAAIQMVRRRARLIRAGLANA